MFFEAVTKGISMKIHADLPVKKFIYAKNTHYIELEDYKGTTTKLVPEAFVKFVCDKCKVAIYLETQPGNIFCPICMNRLNDGIWHKPQLSFVPEKETDFEFRYMDTEPNIAALPDDVDTETDIRNIDEET